MPSRHGEDAHILGRASSGLQVSFHRDIPILMLLFDGTDINLFDSTKYDN